MKTNTRDPETGSRGIVFYYDLGELCQQIAWTFRKQEQEIENLKEIPYYTKKYRKAVYRLSAAFTER